MAKLDREHRLRDRRRDKQARKDARKQAAAERASSQVEAPDRPAEDEAPPAE